MHHHQLRCLSCPCSQAISFAVWILICLKVLILSLRCSFTFRCHDIHNFYHRSCFLCFNEKLVLDVPMSLSTGSIRVFGSYECGDTRQIPLRSIFILQSSFLNGEQPTTTLFSPFWSLTIVRYALLTY